MQKLLHLKNSEPREALGLPRPRARPDEPTRATERAELGARPRLAGLLEGLRPGRLQSRGVLEVLSLFPAQSLEKPPTARADYVAPLTNLKLLEVPTYGTLVLRNSSKEGRLVVPMHVGFFQPGAQNHATSRTLVFQAGETRKVTDCFCVQAAQGGYLAEAEQRFLTLPLGVRRQALARRDVQEFGRLWGDLDGFTRQYGVSSGGHLESFLRPYFPRLQPYRHQIESLPGQVGAAYFVAGELVGLEVAPHPGYWDELSPILAMYCYAAEAIRAEQNREAAAREPVDLEKLRDLDDLAARLEDSRARQLGARLAMVREAAESPWKTTARVNESGLAVETLERPGGWNGQRVCETGETGETGETVYASLFRSAIDERRAQRATAH